MKVSIWFDFLLGDVEPLILTEPADVEGFLLPTKGDRIEWRKTGPIDYGRRWDRVVEVNHLVFKGTERDEGQPVWKQEIHIKTTNYGAV